jgi:hypothetical protein
MGHFKHQLGEVVWERRLLQEPCVQLAAVVCGGFYRSHIWGHS